MRVSKQCAGLVIFSSSLLGCGGMTYTLLHLILPVCPWIRLVSVAGQESKEAWYLTNDTSIEYIGRWPTTFEIPNDPLNFRWLATANEGDKAQYTFHGIQVVVAGEQASPSFDIETATTYTLDGDDQSTVNFTAVGTYNGVLFTSPTVSPGKHTLTMTNVNSSRFGPHGFDVTPNPPGFNESAPSSSSIFSQTKPSSSAPVPLATSNSTETKHTGQIRHRDISTGAIVGILLGGLFAVVMAGWIWKAMWNRRFRYSRRRSNIHSPDTSTFYPPLQEIVTPWRLSRSRNSHSYEAPSDKVYVNQPPNHKAEFSSSSAQAGFFFGVPYQNRHGTESIEHLGGSEGDPQSRLSALYSRPLRSNFGYTRVNVLPSESSVADEVPPPYMIYK